MSASYSQSASSTTQVDKRVTTESGDILSLADNSLSVNSGGSLTVNQNDPAVALKALDAITNSSERIVSSVLSASKDMTSGSNAIAAQVAQAQEKFVETASGQKAITYTVAIAAGVVGLLVLPMVIKSFRRS